MVIFCGVPSGRTKSVLSMSCGLASTVQMNGALSCVLGLGQQHAGVGVNESKPIRSTTSTV
jgi:hypothetical protein